MRRFPIALCLIVVLSGCISRVSTQPVAIETKQPTTAPVAAAPAQIFPTPVVELRGSGAEIGKQHGQKLSGPIMVLFEKYLRPFFHTDQERTAALAIAQGFEPRL